MDMLAAALACNAGAVSIEEAERTASGLEQSGVLHAANLPVRGKSLTTDKATADEKETISLKREGHLGLSAMYRVARVLPHPTSYSLVG